MKDIYSIISLCVVEIKYASISISLINKIINQSINLSIYQRIEKHLTAIRARESKQKQPLHHKKNKKRARCLLLSHKDVKKRRIKKKRNFEIEYATELKRSEIGGENIK